MKLSVEINGVNYKSIDRPKMKHLRIGGRLLNLEQKIEDEPSLMYEYIEEIYGYIKDTFVNLEDSDIDSLSTDKFMQLVKDISCWANGGYQKEQKKN